MLKYFLTVLLCLFLIDRAASQNTSPDSIIISDLPELEIVKSGLLQYKAEKGYSVYNESITTSDQILSSISGLSSLLNRVPGIQFSDRGTQAVGEQITMRGAGWRSQFGVRGLHIIEDDFSITSVDGQTNTEGFNPFFVQGIEVFRGPAALIWGNGGGGVIQLTTFRPDEKAGLTLRSLSGSHQTRKTDISFVQNVQSGKSKLTLSLANTDGYREYSSSQTLQLGFQQLSLLSGNWVRQHKIRYAGLLNSDNPGTLDQQTFDLTPFSARSFFRNNAAGKTTHDLFLGEKLFWIREEKTLSIYSAAGVRSVENPLPFGYIDVDRRHAMIMSYYSVTGSSGISWNLGAETAIQKDRRKESQNLSGKPESDPYLFQDEQLWTISGFFKMNRQIENFALDAGIRADFSQIDVQNLLSSTSGDIQSMIGFANDGITDATLRSLNTKDSYFSLLPAVSFLYTRLQHEFYISFQTAFENPTLSELSNLPEGGTGINPLLNPEKTIAIESGIRSSRNSYTDRLSYDLTFFRHFVTDLLLPFQLNPDGEVFFSNKGNADIIGAEFWLSYSKQLSPSSRMTSDIALSYTNAQFKDQQFEGASLPGVSPWLLNTRMEIQIRSILADLSGQYRSKTTVNNLNTESRHSFMRFDLKIVATSDSDVNSDPNKLSDNGPARGLNRLQWAPFIHVINLTNQLYSESISVNAAGGRFYSPAMPRSVFAGISIAIH